MPRGSCAGHPFRAAAAPVASRDRAGAWRPLPAPALQHTDTGAHLAFNLPLRASQLGGLGAGHIGGATQLLTCTAVGWGGASDTGGPRRQHSPLQQQRLGCQAAREIRGSTAASAADEP